MTQTPVLLIAYNREQKLRQLIRSLRTSAPSLLLVAIDGPKDGRPDDQLRVQRTQDVLSEVNWNCRLNTRFRDTNLGLQTAYVDAVNWAVSEYGRVTVIEDDVIAGPELVEYQHDALDRYESDASIGQINGYNFVPSSHITTPSDRERLTKYPTSYTWSTWARAWEKFGVESRWGLDVPIDELAQITGNRLSAVMWKMNFHNAVSGRVNTWDYQWVSSLWEHKMRIVSPNRNLALYAGFDEGSHTRSRRTQEQQSIESLMTLPCRSLEGVDELADHWHSRHVFREKPIGLVEKILASAYLQFAKYRKSR